MTRRTNPIPVPGSHHRSRQTHTPRASNYSPPSPPFSSPPRNSHRNPQSAYQNIGSSSIDGPSDSPDMGRQDPHRDVGPVFGRTRDHPGFRVVVRRQELEQEFEMRRREMEEAGFPVVIDRRRFEQRIENNRNEMEEELAEFCRNRERGTQSDRHGHDGNRGIDHESDGASGYSSDEGFGGIGPTVYDHNYGPMIPTHCGGRGSQGRGSHARSGNTYDAGPSTPRGYHGARANRDPRQDYY